MARAEQVVEIGDRLHHLGAVGLVGQALVDLQERHDVLVLPQVLGGALAVDLAVHGHLEEDRAEDPVAAEGGAGDDPAAHLVDEVEHLGVVAVGRLVDAVELERLGGAAPALVEGGDEAVARLDLLELSVVHEGIPSGRSWRPPAGSAGAVAIGA